MNAHFRACADSAGPEIAQVITKDQLTLISPIR